MPALQPEGVLPSGADVGGVADTILTISGLGGFQYQARNLTQTLAIIDHSKQSARTINARLKDISNPAFRKYSSKITCNDINVPPIDGLFAGMIVTVQCAAWFSYKIGNPGSPFRPSFGQGFTLGQFNYYHPILEMMVMDVRDSFTEWRCEHAWEIGLEEV